MNKLKKLTCYLSGHDWQNETHYPTHGYRELPNPGSYCGRCGVTA